MTEALALPPDRAVVIRNPSQVLSVTSHWLELKREELVRAQVAAKALAQLGVPPARRRLAKDRVRFLKRFVGALEHGYVPVPRFDADTLNLDLEELPAEALLALGQAKTKRLFDEVRYVTGRQPDSRPGGHYNSSQRWTRARIGGRDPLLVGVIRTPEHRVPFPRWAGDTQGIRTIPGREEHFLIAWWRPEDTTDADLF